MRDFQENQDNDAMRILFSTPLIFSKFKGHSQTRGNRVEGSGISISGACERLREGNGLDRDGQFRRMWGNDRWLNKLVSSWRLNLRRNSEQHDSNFYWLRAKTPRRTSVRGKDTRILGISNSSL